MARNKAQRPRARTIVCEAAFGREFRGPLARITPEELDLTEGRSTGIRKILKAMTENGSPAPIFETDEDRTSLLVRLPVHERALAPEGAGQGTDQVGTKSGPSRDQVEILRQCVEPRPLVELMAISERSNRTKFRDQVLRPLIEAGWIEMTLPEKPTSRLQKYRLTAAGRALLHRETPS